MDIETKKQTLLNAGWHTWYSPNYWVHQKTVQNTKEQDYTNYGMSLDAAYDFEVNKTPPMPKARTIIF